MPQQIKTSEFSWCRTTPLLMSTSTFLGMYFASFLGIFGLFCSALPRHQSVSVHINVLWAVCQSKIPPDKGDLSKNPVHTKLHLWISSPWQEFSKSSVLSDLKCRLHLYRRPKHTEKKLCFNKYPCMCVQGFRSSLFTAPSPPKFTVSSDWSAHTCLSQNHWQQI